MKVTTDACLFGAWAATEIEKEKWKMKTCFDIGTGTGLLSLMMTQKNNILIDAIEIDEEAAEQAKENIAASSWAAQITVIRENVANCMPAKKYDCIISNPPFYEAEIKSETQNKNIAHHSEELKLNKLFKLIKDHLSENGSFFLLLPSKREKELPGLLKQHQLYLHKKLLVRQSTGHGIFRIMIKGGHKTHQQETSEMAIKNGSVYTQEFTDLLKDYYLYL